MSISHEGPAGAGQPGRKSAAGRDRPSRRAQVRRKPERARYDTEAVHAVLDASPSTAMPPRSPTPTT
jgi:hypothetical protein